MPQQPLPLADLELSRRLERAEGHSNAKFVEARARVLPETGAVWTELAGAYCMFDGIASPITQTFGLGLFAPASQADLEAIELFYHERCAPVFHEVSPLADASVLTQLQEGEYFPIEFTSVMYRAINQGVTESRDHVDQLQVRVIESGEEELWTQTTVRGWSEYPELAGFLSELGSINTHQEDRVSLLVDLDERAIAAGAMCIHGGVALLAGACTIPEGRRRGAQRALLNFRLRLAAERGCDVAMMCAQPGSTSQRNAERQGFRIAYTRIKWQKQSVSR